MLYLELVAIRKSFGRKQKGSWADWNLWCKKFFYHVKQRLNPNIMHQLTTSPLAAILLEKLKELHYRVNIFVAIGIPYLVKSMQGVHQESIHEKTSKQNQRGAMAQCKKVWKCLNLHLDSTEAKKDGNKTVINVYSGKWFRAPSPRPTILSRSMWLDSTIHRDLKIWVATLQKQSKPEQPTATWVLESRETQRHYAVWSYFCSLLFQGVTRNTN